MNPDFIQKGKHRKYFLTDKGYNYLQQELLMGGQSFISLAKIFDINPGDNLIVLGDEGNGIAIIKEKGLLGLLNKMRKKD